MIFILLSIMVAGYTQDNPGVLLGWKQHKVEILYTHYKDYYFSRDTDSTLNYENWKTDTYIAYTFKKFKGKIMCTSCSYSVNYADGEELIDSHINNWIEVSDNKWLYKTPYYDLPLVVELKYINNRKVFIYTRLCNNL